MTLHRLLCGDAVMRRPLAGAGDAGALVRSGMFPDRTAPGPHVGRAVRRVLDKALDVRPDRRFASAREMRLALERALPAVSWAPSQQRPDAWDGVATDGGTAWSGVVERRSKA